jgi:LPS export ABC transporter protein LptC
MIKILTVITNYQLLFSMRYYKIALFLSLLLIVSGCGKKENIIPSPPETPTKQDTESRLIFKNITLEQADTQGKPLWKIKANQAEYTQEKKVANLENLAGNLYQDGEIVLKISAAKGKIEQNGEVVWLENEIIAIDPRNNVEIKCQKAQWKPQENLLIIDSEITGNHPQLQVFAKKGKYFTKEEKLVLNNNILAKAIKSSIQLKTEQLTWKIRQQLIIGDRPLDIEKYEKNTVTDRLIAGKGDINLKTEIIYLAENLELNSLNPALQIATKAATWDLNSRTITTKNPLKIIAEKEELTVTGNQGSINLNQEMAYLNSGVTSSSLTQKAELYSTNLTWNILEKLFTAEGNVIYQQTDPEFVATGDKAVGKLTEKNITVSSNGGKRVVTEIVPTEKVKK